MGYLISGFDFHSVLEGYLDVILAINRDEINEALELDGVECCHKVFLFAKRSQKLPDGRAGESFSADFRLSVSEILFRGIEAFCQSVIASGILPDPSVLARSS